MTTVVTKTTGGTAKPVGILYIEPDRQVADAGIGTALDGSGLVPGFAADVLSACLAHERCGVQLYRSVGRRTASEQFRAQYARFEAETLDHVRILEDLISGAGGDAQYVSPSARATEYAAASLLQSTILLTGSADLAAAELSMLEAVMLAEVKDRANWQLLADVAAVITDGALRETFELATTEVLAQEDEHFGWAATTRAEMLYALVTGLPGASASSDDAVVIDLTEMTYEELYATAQEFEIAGRSQMDKSELADAIETGATR